MLPKESEKSNFETTKNIVNCIKNLNKHIIFLSTDKVFDGTDPYPDENSPTRPQWMRAKFKVDCENLISERFSKFHILRLSMVHDIGSNDSHSFIDKAIIDIKRKKITKAFNNVFRCYILHSELSNLLSSVIFNKNYGIYNVGSKLQSYYQRICRSCKDNNIPFEDYIIPIEGNAIPISQDLDTTKFRKTFNISLY